MAGGENVNLTNKEVAARYGVTTTAVRHWIKGKKIPYEYQKVVGIKPRIIVKLEDVEKALNLYQGGNT